MFAKPPSIGLSDLKLSECLDTPADAMGDQWGERTGVGLDVEWEEREAAYETSEGSGNTA